MKLKYFILLSIFASISFYIYQDNSLRSKFLGKVHQVVPEMNKSTLYKWQNSAGEWQVTDRPPIKGIAFTTITTQDQVNVMPGPTKKKK